MSDMMRVPPMPTADDLFALAEETAKQHDMDGTEEGQHDAMVIRALVRIAREPLTPAPRVVMLDEWRVLMDCGDMADGTECFREEYAHTLRRQMDAKFPFNAPHRVVRVALVSEESLTEAPADGA